MKKHTAFLEYKREVPPDRRPLDRINDWEEFHLSLSEERQMHQGARCMDCGVPFCHSGTMINGMVSGCPLNNLIPEWNELVCKGLWEEAAIRLQKTNSFPEFTGRVCPAPCEGACTMGINEPQTTIRANECAIIDRAFEKGWIVPMPPKKRTGKKVAVVGSGPSGLACALELNRLGHRVTVFERSDRAGGLLMYGIPNMKLSKKVVKRRIDLMAAEGITFVTGTEVGKDYPIDKLQSEFDSVVLCGGATKARDINASGRELKGIHFAMDFLRGNTKALLDLSPTEGVYISAKEKDVLIIGGGDTGTDCVATSIRHKCKSATQLEIMPKPSKGRTDDNPWPEWPKVLKVDYGQEEAIAVFGRDPREYCITVKKFIGDDSGSVKQVETVNVEWKKDENGRFSPVKVAGSEKIWPADLVLICMGFVGPEDGLLNQLGVEKDERSNVRAEYGRFSTNVDGVFAAGDMRRGQSLVVWAINEGRLAAGACSDFLCQGTVRNH